MTKKTNPSRTRDEFIAELFKPSPTMFAELIAQGISAYDAGVCANYPDEVCQRLAIDCYIPAAYSAYMTRVKMALADAVAGRIRASTTANDATDEDADPWTDAAEEFVTCRVQGYSIEDAMMISELNTEKVTALLLHPKVEQGAVALLTAVHSAALANAAPDSAVLFPAGK